MKLKNYGDWYLILIYLFIAAMWLISCTKSGYKPDHDQTTCKYFWDIKEIWQDSAIGYIRTDTNFKNSGMVCGKWLDSATVQLKRSNENFPNPWHRICNPNGELTHWEYWKPELK